MSSINGAFSTQGATPGFISRTQTSTPMMGSGGGGPIQSAVMGVLHGIGNATAPLRQSFNNGVKHNSETPDASGTHNLYGGLLQTAPPASTPVASHTITDPSGNQIKTVYHKPVPGLINSGPINTVAKAQVAGAASAPKVAGATQTAQPATPVSTQTASQIPASTPIGSGTPTTTADQNAIASQTGNNSGNAYAGMVGNIGKTANQGATDINTAANSNQAAPAITNLNQTAAGNIPLGQNAQNIASTAGQQIADLGKLNGVAGGFETNGLLGNAGAVRNTIANEQQAISQGAQTALQGNAQALTGQGQAAGAYNEAGGLGLTNQGQQIQGATSAGNLATQGATSAATLAKPELSQYGQTYYQPTQAGQSGGNITLSGQPASDISNLAASVANNSVSYQTAYSQISSAYGSAVANQLLPAIQKSNPNFNVNSNAGTASAQTSTAETGGQYQATLNQAHNQTQQLNDLITSFGLNPNDINALNAGLQKIATNVSSPQYQALQNYVNAIGASYDSILGTTGSGASLINSTASGKGISGVLSTLEQQAQAKIAGSTTNSQTPSTSGFGWNG